MNKEKQRIAIAEFCEWDFDPQEAHQWKSRGRWAKSPKGNLVFRHSIPNYHGDIDAMRDAVGALTYEQAERFSDLLWDLSKRDNDKLENPKPMSFAFATTSAEMQAEAMVRAIGKWEESE